MVHCDDENKCKVFFFPFRALCNSGANRSFYIYLIIVISGVSLIKMHALIYLKEMERERIFYQLLPSPNVFQESGQVITQARNPDLLVHVGDSDPSTRAILSGFPRCSSRKLRRCVVKWYSEVRCQLCRLRHDAAHPTPASIVSIIIMTFDYTFSLFPDSEFHLVRYEVQMIT